jgi:hypothetical protein
VFIKVAGCMIDFDARGTAQTELVVRNKTVSYMWKTDQLLLISLERSIVKASVQLALLYSPEIASHLVLLVDSRHRQDIWVIRGIVNHVGRVQFGSIPARWHMAKTTKHTGTSQSNKREGDRVQRHTQQQSSVHKHI